MDIGYQGDLKISKADIRGKSVEVEHRSKKTEENKHGAVIAGCSAESETLFWEQKSKFEST